MKSANQLIVSSKCSDKELTILLFRYLYGWEQKMVETSYGMKYMAYVDGNGDIMDGEGLVPDFTISSEAIMWHLPKIPYHILRNIKDEKDIFTVTLLPPNTTKAIETQDNSLARALCFSVLKYKGFKVI